jgi:hypothetical protein
MPVYVRRCRASPSQGSNTSSNLVGSVPHNRQYPAPAAPTCQAVAPWPPHRSRHPASSAHRLRSNPHSQSPALTPQHGSAVSSLENCPTPAHPRSASSDSCARTRRTRTILNAIGQLTYRTGLPQADTAWLSAWAPFAARNSSQPRIRPDRREPAEFRE